MRSRPQTTEGDQFIRFRRRDVAERQIDTLIGLCQGAVADGVVTQAEAKFLHRWLIRNEITIVSNPFFHPLLQRVSEMLEDGHLDRDEAAELCATLKQFSGKDSAAGELLRTTDLPLNQPAPSFRFRGRHFVCTGTFAYGKRERCHEAIEYRGGVVKSGISKKVDYLILGYYVTPSWKHEQFGRKIEKAMLYRDQGVPISIISEEHWRKHGGI